MINGLVHHAPESSDKQIVGMAAWEHFSHDADIGVSGTGATPEEAFEQAAMALTAVVTRLEAVQPRHRVDIVAENNDIEMLFVDWLDAIIYEMAIQKMLFSRFKVRIAQGKLTASAWGERVDIGRHDPAVEVKGATLTELKVTKTADGNWTARCIVDV